MKKILFFITLSLLVTTQLFCASKKELEEKIDTLNIQKESLEAKNKEYKTSLYEKNKKIDELNKENQRLKDENEFYKNQIKETENAIQKAFSIKGALISDGIENGHKVLRRSYVDIIKTKWLYKKSSADIYKNPVINGKPIGFFKEGDTIISTELILVDSYDLWLKIITDSVSGYILLDTHGSDWFKDNNNIFLENIATTDGIFTVRQTKLKKSLQSEEQIKTQEIPGKSGKISDSFTFKNKFTTIPVTVTKYTTDLQWIFVENEEGSGWISSNLLSPDIGGPKIPAPECNIYFYLVEQP